MAACAAVNCSSLISCKNASRELKMYWDCGFKEWSELTYKSFHPTLCSCNIPCSGFCVHCTQKKTQKQRPWTFFSPSPFGLASVFCWAVTYTQTEESTCNKRSGQLSVGLVCWNGQCSVQWTKELMWASGNTRVGLVGGRRPAFRGPWKLQLILRVPVDAAVRDAIFGFCFPVWTRWTYWNCSSAFMGNCDKCSLFTN